jgi:hypothetical protein
MNPARISNGMLKVYDKIVWHCLGQMANINEF